MSRLTGMAVVPITASESSAPPSGIEGSSPAITPGGRVLPERAVAKHAIIKATTHDKSDVMRLVSREASMASDSGPRDRVAKARSAGGSSGPACAALPRASSVTREQFTLFASNGSGG